MDIDEKWIENAEEKGYLYEGEKDFLYSILPKLEDLNRAQEDWFEHIKRRVICRIVVRPAPDK